MSFDNSHQNAHHRRSESEMQLDRNDLSQLASQTIPVFHVRHNPSFSTPSYPRQQPGSVPFTIPHNMSACPHPPYLPGVPMPYWTPPMTHHRYQKASQGPYREHYQHPYQPVDQYPPQALPNASFPRESTPIGNLSEDDLRDLHWPDLNELNKTPTKASLRGQHRSSIASTQPTNCQILPLGEKRKHEARIVRKDAVARLTAARDEDKSFGAACSIGPELDSFYEPLGSRQVLRQISTPNKVPGMKNQNEIDASLSPPLSISRTSTISTGLDGSPLPSLSSLSSFGDGIWGHEDVPMLKSRLSETVRLHNRGDKGDREQPGFPLDYGLHDELPYTPLMDQLNLFASPPTDLDDLESGVHGAIYLGDKEDNYDGDTTMFDNECSQVKDNSLKDKLRHSIKEEIVAIRNDILNEVESSRKPDIDHTGRLRSIMEKFLEQIEQGESVKGTGKTASSSIEHYQDLEKNLIPSLQPFPHPPVSFTENLGPARNMPLLSDSKSPSVGSPILDVPQPNRSGTTFASILLDGDSTLFHPDLIKKGAVGGQQAAFALSTAVYHLCLDHSDSGTVPNCFTVQVFFKPYQQAIGARLVETGVINSTKLLAEFSAGFTNSHGLFTFINVGTRQTAANKIKEHLRLFANIDACRLILLGTNQGYEYKKLLSDFNAVGQGSKIYAARSTDPDGVDPLDKVLGFRLQAIPGLFRTAVAGVEPDESETADQDDDDDRSLRDSDRDSNEGSIEFTKAPSGVIEHTVQLVPVSVTSQDDFTPVLSRKKKPALTAKMSYASSAMSTKNVSFVRTTGTDAKKRKKGRSLASTQYTILALDYDHADYLSVKRYQPRPCHRFYLTNGCKNGPKCHYGHDYELTKGEINALKSLSKEMLCPAYAIGTCKGSNETCIYGHECPRNQECTLCVKDRFPDNVNY